jgi:hypothetical protein
MSKTPLPSWPTAGIAAYESRLFQSRRAFLAAASAAGLGLPLAFAAHTDQLAAAETDADVFRPVEIPEWVFDVTRMAFLTPGEVAKAAQAGVQVVHGNAVWPYYPLRRDGGGLRPDDDRLLRQFADECHRHQMNLVLGLPPFPPVELVQKHPQWRVYPDDSGMALRVPVENDLGTRVCCNLGP